LTKKRVWALYRVSTKKQVNVEDDIPMQRTACHNFVATKSDWEITNELYEKGVSGWKKKTDERDVLNTIKESALKREFDILLVFMLDRLGRREDESPLVVSFLHENDIEVWSVQEGRRSVESHVDKLITYIGFWQSSGESLKTSLRVKESKKQLSEQGHYQGGTPPYGYKVIDTNEKHWKSKDRFLKKLIPDEYESQIVELVFDLYVNSHCGYRKITDKLNEKGYKNRDDKPFRVSTIQRILTNPICIGLKNYKSFDGSMESQPYNEELRIISDEMFNNAKKIRTKRSDALKEQDKSSLPMSGKLMFSGIARCGYCDSKLSGNYLYRNTKVTRGEKHYEYKTAVYRYRCPLNKGKVAEEHGKNIWGAKKFDKIILDRVKSIISLIDIEQFIDTNVDRKRKNTDAKKTTIKSLTKDKIECEKQIAKLNGEIAKSLTGDSFFSPEQLSSAISSKTEELEQLELKITSLQNEIDSDNIGNYEIENLADEIKNWEDRFDNADEDLKKAMLSRVIDKIEFYKEDVDIYFNLQIKELLKVSIGEV
jgi:site-specific DNA recombinase